MRNIHIEPAGPVWQVWHGPNVLASFPTREDASAWAKRISRPQCRRIQATDYGMIAHILGNVHCMSRNITAVREVLGRIKGGWKRVKGQCCRYERRALIRAILYHHEANQRLYVSVMTGRL